MPPDTVIENPVLNSPFEEPSRHFLFDDTGITSTVVEERRPSSYFVPIPAAKRAKAQLAFGTVGPLQIKNAAIEAVRGLGHDVLIVCGFAFDAQADETAKQFGELVVLPTRMNPDLLMGEELLKKTGAGNLFMVFGEPDVNIREQDGDLVVELLGLDVYDPTTGDIRSNPAEELACWFIDTDYNRESFFVRHAYFTGNQEPYERLKRALKAEIDEDAWLTLYSTVSRPFPKPETGRIAIKVINHYGDEVLKVYEV